MTKAPRITTVRCNLCLRYSGDEGAQQINVTFVISCIHIAICISASLECVKHVRFFDVSVNSTRDEIIKEVQQELSPTFPADAITAHPLLPDVICVRSLGPNVVIPRCEKSKY